MAGQAATVAAATHGWRTLLLRLASKRFDKPASILSDNDSCFVGQGGRRKGLTGRWQSTVCEEKLLENGIVLINPRPYHPQTNGKLERFHHSREDKIWNYGGAGAYIGHSNEARLHFPPILTTTRCPEWHSGTRRQPERSGCQLLKY